MTWKKFREEKPEVEQLVTIRKRDSAEDWSYAAGKIKQSRTQNLYVEVAVSEYHAVLDEDTQWQEVPE